MYASSITTIDSSNVIPLMKAVEQNFTAPFSLSVRYAPPSPSLVDNPPTHYKPAPKGLLARDWTPCKQAKAHPLPKIVLTRNDNRYLTLLTQG